MRVIFLQDVENVGKKYEVNEVKNGYARNFLIPQGLVKPATPESLEWLEKQQEIEKKKIEEDLKKVQDLASRIDGLEVVIPVKIGEEGQLFEKIDEQNVVVKLKELGFEVNKKQIELVEPIKEVGEFPIKIRFEHNLEAEIRVIVSEEKS